MEINGRGISLLHEFESCRLQAYKCPAAVWTIGWGNTFYEDNTPVKQGEVITQERADQLFDNILNRFSISVRKLVKRELNKNQFSALVSFAYNVGIANLGKSTLLKKVNANPCDPTIKDEFLRWNKAAGKVLNGLTRRRQAEANLYFL